MACKTSFELHHHFPKLAEESGFAFNTHRPRVHIDWNKIRLIDIDSLIKERKFIIIEQHLNDILDCVFESEFDVRILDEGVMKMFRLAQLAIEYQQFCRHYLDRSVYVLREEITSLAQELDTCKKDLREKEEEIRRLRKRSRQSFKTTLPYGNDNIAALILKTLSHKGDIISSPSNDSIHYNKCNYCDKVFLNQLYLKSHISRRHGHIIEVPHKDKSEDNPNNENTKISAEITELRNKIIEMENIISTKKNQTANGICEKEPQINSPVKEVKNENNVHIIKKDMKDAEVSTNNEEYLLNKIEEWKKQEHENYNKEMHMLRLQILETINTIKEKGNQETVSTEPNIIIELHETIKQQGAEIIALKKELTECKYKAEKENAERNKIAESQASYWANRNEVQSKQYELLLQKLNDVANDAKESRILAEAERKRATQLQVLLQQRLNSKSTENVETADDMPGKDVNKMQTNKKSIKTQPNQIKSQHQADDNSLQKLHRKAQELLNIASISSSSSDASEALINNVNNKPSDDSIHDRVTYKSNKVDSNDDDNKPTKVNEKPSLNMRDTRSLKGLKVKKQTLKRNHTKSSKIKNGPTATPVPSSPIKLVRAKITEEVNTRLVSTGVDPLKSRLLHSLFRKQQMQLHQLQELKAKKNPAYNKARHSILAFLDTNTPDLNKEIRQIPDYISPTKVKKPFKNISSVISNVKTRALSLVKLNDSNSKGKPISQNIEVAKRAMSLLKTPPDSASTSPISAKRSPLRTFSITQNVQNPSNEISKSDQKSKNKKPLQKFKKSSNVPKILETSLAASYSEDDSEENDYKQHNSKSVTSSKSIEFLIKSPVRRPSSALGDFNNTAHKYISSDDNLLRTQSVDNLVDHTVNSNNIIKKQDGKQSTKNNSSDESDSNNPPKEGFVNDGALETVKQTKSVLKNASSTSSLNKKKVLFDMDAIQMKSVSASPSQSVTERSDENEKFELGLVDFDGEEWDISSIENETLKNDTKIQNVTRTGPKIAELKNKIESQLARRNETLTTALIGGVDLLAGNILKPSSIGGSNTSLGSSILDDSESVPIPNHKAVKPKKILVNENSDIDVSDFSIDGDKVKKSEYF